MKTRVLVKDEVSEVIDNVNRVCFQKVVYQYAEGGTDDGFRFINRSVDSGNMKAQGGQCRLPTKQLITSLLEKAESAGMFL